MHNSHRLTKGPERWHLLMHPGDMEKRQIRSGDTVRITSPAGEVTTTVSASDEMMEGVVSLPHGWGHQMKGVRLSIAAEQQGVNCNKLTESASVDAVSGNAALNGSRVQIATIKG